MKVKILFFLFSLFLIAGKAKSQMHSMPNYVHIADKTSVPLRTLYTTRLPEVNGVCAFAAVTKIKKR